MLERLFREMVDGNLREKIRPRRRRFELGSNAVRVEFLIRFAVDASVYIFRFFPYICIPFIYKSIFTKHLIYLARDNHPIVSKIPR